MNKQNKHQLDMPGRVNVATRLAQAESAVCIGVLLLAACAPARGVIVVKPLLDPGQMAFAGAVDIGGRKLWLECAGIGDPAIIFDAGLQRGGWKPAHLAAELAAVTRVCFYDRPNTVGGRSDPVAGARTSQDIVNDLETLLFVAGAQPPWILIGHGFGGMNMTLFATQHPNQVTGLILMDPLPPNTIERWAMMLRFSEGAVNPMAYNRPIADLARGAAENIDLAISAEQLRSAPGLGRMPVRLIAASRPLDGWVAVPDPLVGGRLARVWKEDRAFYDRLAPGIRLFEVDDDNALGASASEELILDQAIELIIRYRTCCGPLAMVGP
jgi:pimeloyl-ACP methyl ester carboxylesterase